MGQAASHEARASEAPVREVAVTKRKRKWPIPFTRFLSAPANSLNSESGPNDDEERPIPVSAHGSLASFVHVNAVKEPRDLGAQKLDTKMDPAKAVEHVVVKNEFINHPVITDEESIAYVKKNRFVLIIRGLAGSGKSTLVDALLKTYSECDPVVCSADHFFLTGNGDYNFDATKLKNAHAECQQKYRSALEDSKSLVIVDNTNVQLWEMQYYFKVAHQYSYRTILLEPSTPWCLDAAQLAQKNSHGVPEKLLRKKVQMFKDIVPLYYAWFLNKQDSEFLLRHGQEWLQTCLDECGQFENDFTKFARAVDRRSQLGYFSRNSCLVSNREVVHCTAKFCGRTQSAASYAQIDTVKLSLGKLFELRVIGFVISKNTFGARIKLNDRELDLYGQNDDERPGFVASKKSKTTGHSPSPMKDNDSSEKVPDFCVRYESQDVSSNRFLPISGLGRRAHITLGTADGVAPVTTGFDVLSAVQAEEEAANGQEEALNFPVKNGIIRRYKKGLWVIYPDHATMLQAVFSGHYD